MGMVLALVTGCGTIAKLGHGSRKPRIEKELSIIQWLDRNGMSAGDKMSSSPEEYYFFAPRFLGSIMVFDRNGRFHAVGYHQGKYCVNDVDVILKQLRPADELFQLPDSFIVYQYNEPYKIDNVHEKSKKEVKNIVREYLKTAKYLFDTLYLNYSMIAEKMRTLSGDQIARTADTTVDYTLVLTNARFEGNWVQIRDLRKYYKAALSNPYAKFRILFLNLDKQAWWGTEWNEKIRIDN